MPTITKIQFAHHTASPWYGCEHAKLADGTPHPGCLHCYAEALAKRNPATLGEWGPAGRRVVSKSFHDACRKWNAAAVKAGERRRVFPSLCDPFEDWLGEMRDSKNGILHRCACGRDLPWESVAANGVECECGKLARVVSMDDCRRDLFATIDAFPQLDFLLFTKRPQNVRRMWPAVFEDTAEDCEDEEEREFFAETVYFRGNGHLIYSASDQPSLDSGWEDLLACDDYAGVLGLSLEPLTGPITLPRTVAKCPHCGRDPKAVGLRNNASEPFSYFCSRASCANQFALPSIDWVIVGGESGANARPCNPAWIRSIVKQCQAAGVPCFVKQLGSNIVTRNDMVDDAFNSLNTGWPDPVVEHHIHGFREDYQGADCRIRLRHKKGGDPEEWPEDLRVREFPDEVLHG